MKIASRFRTTKIQRALGLAALIVCVAKAPAAAKEPTPLVRKWNERLQEVVQLLQAGKPEPALKATDKLLEEMMAKVVPGDGSGKAFAMGLTLQALAEAGLGLEREAAWHWQVAQQLEPTMEGWDLASFGAPAEVLARHRLSVDPQPEAMAIDRTKPEIVGPKLRQRVYDNRHPGTAKRSVNPSPGAVKEWGEDSLMLVVVLGADGRASHPRFKRQPHDLAMAVSGSNWLLDAEFDPATLNGIPTPCSYSWSLKLTSELRMR